MDAHGAVTATTAHPATASADGDPVASAYRDHGEAVYAAASAACGPEAAVAVTREVFVRLRAEPGWFDPAGGALRAFLVSVAYVRASEVDRTGSHPAPDPADGSGRSLAALRALPHVEREALVLAFYAQCSYQEVARRLAQTEEATRSSIRLGLLRLGAALRQP